LKRGLASSIDMFNAKNQETKEILDRMKTELATPVQNPGFKDYEKINIFVRKIFSDVNNGLITADQNLLSQLEEAAIRWTESWDYLPLDYAMEFVRDDANMMSQSGGRKLRYFPASGFVLPVNVENAVEAGIITEEYADQALSEIRFDFRQGGYFRSDVNMLSREEVMMLDILANFDWKRGIYFSSPGGSDVAKALLKEQYLASLGQVHGLVPLKGKAANDFSRENMYDNVMNKYHYANLNGEGVLVDYYTRRHTSQYRNNFVDLATKYLDDYQKAKNNPGSGNLESAEYYADKVEEIISYSLEKLPIDKVFDFGEPRASGRRLSNGQQIFIDGAIPDYVQALYNVDKTEMAEQLAIDYMHQLETMMNYFEHSDAMIAYENKDDFISFSMNFLRVYAQVLVGSPDSEAESLAHALDQKMTRDVVGKIVEELRTKQIKETIRGGSTRLRTMEKEALEFAKIYNALLSENGFQSDSQQGQE